MDCNVRPETMARITTKELADALVCDNAQVYVIDDAELQKVQDNYPVMPRRYYQTIVPFDTKKGIVVCPERFLPSFITTSLSATVQLSCTLSPTKVS